MTDWATISALATAGGTLVLAAATFASVRSAHQSARATERALLAGIRPLVVPSRLDDPPEKVGFGDNVWLKVEGGRAAVKVTDDVIYLAIALRNAGSGIAVLDRWDLSADHDRGDFPHREPDEFRRLTRDIYIPAGSLGFWQGAFRDTGEPLFDVAHEAIGEPRVIAVDLLYGDLEGGQRTISRFMLTPSAGRPVDRGRGQHWNLDRADPR